MGAVARCTSAGAFGLGRDFCGTAVITRWEILTGEYPPQPGGVADYTRLLASALAASGDDVRVWAPPGGVADRVDAGVTVNRLPDQFGRRSRRLLDRALDETATPRRILLQYVPQAFAWKGANVPFCLWLCSRRSDEIWIMFHEVAHPVGARYGLGGNLLGLVTRGMAALLSRSAQRGFVSIPAWRPMLASWGGASMPVTWLPVPSSVPEVRDPDGSRLVHDRVAGGRPLVGHLGTYGRLIGSMLADWLPVLLATTDCHVLLLGRRGDRFRRDFTQRYPQLGHRITSSGSLPEDELSRHVSACDLMIQPYPDGVSTRRTSLMVGLSHGRPIVTTLGRLSEPFWANCDALLIGSADDPAATARVVVGALAHAEKRAELSAGARTLYAERFDLRHTVERLRSAGRGESLAPSRVASGGRQVAELT
jgi:glycosyltransferase involved in cell wall biosynthesis